MEPPDETAAAVGAIQNARAALLSGVTTVRDVGSPFLTNIEIRDLIQEVTSLDPGLRPAAAL